MNKIAFAGLDVSRETFERLEAYFSILKKWNPAINLVAKSTVENAWDRHFLDSAQVFALAPKESKSWVDIGSGGGFPGLVCAVLAAEHAPEMAFTLVESDQRKAEFLRTVARDLNVPVTVIAKRIEDIPPLNADIISARALAALPLLLNYAERHLSESGLAIFQKGANVSNEIAESLETWRFTYEEYPSATGQDAVTLLIGDIRRV
ncbi:16S rRNA (guanine527-N7)-methyltransferase [Celeribacter baekdonensis]|uniref:Ribosomal RNA small subunit methyltransferase G n=1 Tax=Celeribacter baekdonensis TaxID=875171 RepID=A0A1G7LBJ4_9RHOB|nr:16S rRNA (guanine(527)-N(7))-methyltransferase RsmG [Celeribacter baekdonensis]SDF46823.1 16S rRNA (guanine527-N7)-methyltransferase [Celeribacter baekdonensis]